MEGLSIFQGAGSIQLNTSENNRLEEEEAIEDQKRRNEELGNQLQNAFDDLLDDDEYTLDSSSNFQSHLLNGDINQKPVEQCRNRNEPINFGQPVPMGKVQNFELSNHGHQHRKINQLYDELGKMKKIIESKNNEIENITKIVQEERKKNDEVSKRLVLSEAERARHQMTKQQSHELLVESKAKCSELEDGISKIKLKVKHSEETNTKLIGDLERTRNMLADVQHKYHIVEKNAGFSADRHAELLVKQAHERHEAQVTMLQQQIDNLRNKLDDKEMEVKTLDTRYNELQRNRETLLIDKTETINQLSRSLEDSQRQCQILMSKQDFTQENIRLSRHNSALEKQTEDMQKTIYDLTERLEATTAELEMMGSVLHENSSSPVDDDGGELNTPRRNSLLKNKLVGSTPLTALDKIPSLKNEVYRCMSSQKEKRNKIKKLEQGLAIKDEEIKSLKEEENKCLVQISNYKEENSRLENQLHLLQEDLTELTNLKPIKKKFAELKVNHENLEFELKKVKNDLEEAQNTLQKKEREYFKSDEEERRKIDSKIKNLNIDLEELRQEHESLKLNYENLIKENEQLKRRQSLDPLKLEVEKQRFLLKDAQKECDRIKNLYIEVSNAKESLVIELTQIKQSNIHKEYQELQIKAINLEKALELADLKCSELSKLLEAEKSAKEREVQDIKNKIEKEKIEIIMKSPKNSSNNCSKCIEHVTEITKLEIQNIKLENQCSLYFNKLSDLKKELSEANNLITDLNGKLSLKMEQDKLIAELKQKAQTFEDYIKFHVNNSPTSSSGVSSSHSVISKRDQNVGTSPEIETHNNQKESQIRAEMAKIFAIELKNNEDNFKKHILEFDDLNSKLKEDLIKVNTDLKQRQNEVRFLKEAILSERESFEEIFKLKEIEIKKFLEKQNLFVQKCQSELIEKQTRIDELVRDIGERNEQIERERMSMKAVMNQWEENREKKDKIESSWKKIVSDLETEYKKTLESTQAKYESAKRTVFNYKRYSKDLENHYIQEGDRIVTESSLYKAQMQNKYEEFCKNRNKKHKEEIAAIRLEYEKKFINLKTEHT